MQHRLRRRLQLGLTHPQPTVARTPDGCAGHSQFPGHPTKGRGTMLLRNPIRCIPSVSRSIRLGNVTLGAATPARRSGRRRSPRRCPSSCHRRRAYRTSLCARRRCRRSTQLWGTERPLSEARLSDARSRPHAAQAAERRPAPRSSPPSGSAPRPPRPPDPVSPSAPRKSKPAPITSNPTPPTSRCDQADRRPRRIRSCPRSAPGRLRLPVDRGQSTQSRRRPQSASPFAGRLTALLPVAADAHAGEHAGRSWTAPTSRRTFRGARDRHLRLPRVVRRAGCRRSP